MKLILKLLLLLLFVVSCKTKHLQIELKEDKHKEVKKSQKDSVFEQRKASKTNVFQVDNSQSVEIELETEKDSTGQSKTLEFERIRSPSSEKIIVKGGKVKIKSVGKTYMSSAQKDTLQVNNTSVRTSENTLKTTENKTYQKEKKVKGNGVLLIAYSLLLLALIIFLAWRLKLFRWVSTIITTFKKYFNKV